MDNTNKQKPRWFKFFFIYKGAFIEINPFRCKKLIIAICDYAESGKIPKLDKKTMEYFKSFQLFFDTDIEISRKNGIKGSSKRWNNNENRQSNGVPSRKNRVSTTKK